MSYRIQTNEPLAKAILRIAAEENAQAAQLDHQPHLVEKVHDARRSLKRLRALLEVLDGSVPERFIDTETRRFRDVGRLLAPFRDWEVLVITLEKVKVADGNKALLQLRHSVQKQRADLVQRAPAIFDQARRRLLRAERNLPRWPVSELAPSDLAAGLTQAYKHGRKLLQRARKKRKPGTLHKLRQQTKALWHGMQLVESFNPKPIQGLAKEAECTADCLGTDHDLVMLCERLQAEPKPACKCDLKKLDKAIGRKRAKLQKRAFKSASKLYAAKPAAFGKKMKRWLNG